MEGEVKGRWREGQGEGVVLADGMASYTLFRRTSKHQTR